MPSDARRRKSRMKLTSALAAAPWMLAAGVLLSLPAHAVVFDNGTVNDFSGVEPADGLFVLDGPGGQPTTVNVRAGAMLGSTSEVSGGSLIRTDAGSTFADTLRSVDAARLELSGGSFRVIDLENNSTATISGGGFSCAGSGRCMGLFDSSRATISGGGFTDQPIIAYGTSQLTVLGGSFGGGLWADRGTIDLFGGDVQSMQSTNAVFTVYGSDFVVYENGGTDPLFTGFGEIPEFTTGVLDGRLADGTALSSLPYLVGNNGRIVLAPVPEPAVSALLAAGLVTLAGLGRRRDTRLGRAGAGTCAARN